MCTGTLLYERCDHRARDTYRTYGDELVGVVHHGDQQVQQHDDVDDRKCTEHQQAPKPGIESMVLMLMATQKKVLTIGASTVI